MPSENRQRTRQTKYQPLIDFLAVQTDRDVTLSFAEVEVIIGRSLAVSASNDPGTWHSTLKLPVRQWQEMGWHARFDRRDQCVHFTRDAEDAADARR